jgi:hypothetical protein
MKEYLQNAQYIERSQYYKHNISFNLSRTASQNTEKNIYKASLVAILCMI